MQEEYEGKDDNEIKSKETAYKTQISAVSRKR